MYPGAVVTELSRRVIAEARRIRTEWETEPEWIDEILGRVRPKDGTEFQIEDVAEATAALRTPFH
jgi:hypothetical protein